MDDNKSAQHRCWACISYDSKGTCAVAPRGIKSHSIRAVVRERATPPDEPEPKRLKAVLEE